jgi:hypothetical protein
VEIQIVELGEDLGTFGEPSGIGLRTPIVATQPIPPLVVLEHASPVVLDLLGEQGFRLSP